MASRSKRNSEGGATAAASEEAFVDIETERSSASDDDVQQVQKQRQQHHSPSSSSSNRSKASEIEINNSHNHQPPPPQQQRHYSVAELVRTLGNHDDTNTGLPPELERRALDFRLARRKRRSKYGAVRHGGIYGLYQHLSCVRTDLEWAEDAAWRRQHGEPYLAWTDFDDARLLGIRNVPWFTYGFMFICSIMMIVEFAVNGWKVEPMDVNLMIGPSAETLIKVGARATTLIVEEGEWYRLFSPLVLHAGIIHYFINMLALWFIGKAVEHNHGSLNALVVFLISGVGANVLSAIFLPEYISVGASGGIFGLIGACIADLGKNWKILSIRDAEETEKEVFRRNTIALFTLVVEITINILIGLVTPFIDNWAHLGGLVYGCLCAFSTLEALPVGFFGVVDTTWGKIRKLIVRFSGLIVTLVLIIISSAWLATSDPGETPCTGCRYVSCVPFPLFKEEKWWYCDKCDFVKYNATMDAESGIYKRVTLFCPDESLETFDISDEIISDKQEFQRKLQTYCREQCDNIF